MSKTLFRKMGTAALAAALAAPLGVNAESSFTSGSGALSTSAHVDFQVTIPKFVSLRVGSTGANIDLISFTVPAVDLGTSLPVAGTGGDLNNGMVTAAVAGNGGAVSLGASTGGALGNGTATIDWSEITTNSNNGSLPAPVLANGPSAPVSVPAIAGIVSQTAAWTYSYDNTVVVPPGTYGGAGINNGRVTYTASVP